MTNVTLLATVENITQDTAIIITEQTEDLFQCGQAITTPALNFGDVVRLTLSPERVIENIVIDYAEMQRRYPNA